MAETSRGNQRERAGSARPGGASHPPAVDLARHELPGVAACETGKWVIQQIVRGPRHRPGSQGDAEQVRTECGRDGAALEIERSFRYDWRRLDELRRTLAAKVGEVGRVLDSQSDGRGRGVHRVRHAVGSCGLLVLAEKHDVLGETLELPGVTLGLPQANILPTGSAL